MVKRVTGSARSWSNGLRVRTIEPVGLASGAEAPASRLMSAPGVAVNYYDVLGVEQKASHDEIRRAYRRLARAVHPDKNGTPEAVERFQALNAANEVHCWICLLWLRPSPHHPGCPVMALTTALIGSDPCAPGALEQGQKIPVRQRTVQEQVRCCYCC